MEEKLSILVAKDEIRDVLMRYCRGIDRCDPDLVAACYHPGPIDNHGSFQGPADEFARRAVEYSRILCESTYFCLSNAIIEVDGDAARSESYYHSAKVLTERTPEGAVQVRLSGVRNLDKFEKRDGEWRIVKRQLIGEWGINTPFGGGPAFPPGGTPAPRGRRDREDLSYPFWEGAQIYV
jgi:hypothetical protein